MVLAQVALPVPLVAPWPPGLRRRLVRMRPAQTPRSQRLLLQDEIVLTWLNILLGRDVTNMRGGLALLE